jgi:hypothetical protein
MAPNMLRIRQSLLTNFLCMKSFKYIATLTMAIAGLTTHVDATPITYSYIGANFTSTDTAQPGFSTNDNLTARFTVNNLLAPSMTFNLTSIGATMATISNGVFTLSLNGLFETVTTDASGNIVAWGLNAGAELPDSSLLDFSSVRIGAIVGDDAHEFLPDGSSFNASTTIPGTWSSGPAGVPDQGATITLICLALVTLLGFKYAQLKSVPAKLLFPEQR